LAIIDLNFEDFAGVLCNFLIKLSGVSPG